MFTTNLISVNTGGNPFFVYGIITFVIIGSVIGFSYYLGPKLMPLYWLITKKRFRYTNKEALQGQDLRKLVVGAFVASQSHSTQNRLKIGFPINERAIRLASEQYCIHSHESAVGCFTRFASQAKIYYNVVRKAFDAQDPHSIVDTTLRDLGMSDSDIAYSFHNYIDELKNIKEVIPNLLKDKVLSSADEIKKLGTSAWYWGRISYMARVAYTAGYLSKEEAWSWIEKAYEQSLTEFDSWEDFAKSYLIGRYAWAGPDSATNDIIAEIGQHLLSDSDSPWQKISWK